MSGGCYRFLQFIFDRVFIRCFSSITLVGQEREYLKAGVFSDFEMKNLFGEGGDFSHTDNFIAY